MRIILAAVFATVLGLTVEVKAAEVAGENGGSSKGYISTDDGTRLYYEKAGSGPTIILPLHLFTFEAFRSLADKFTVIAYDTRGRGQSDAIPDAEKAKMLGIRHDLADLERVRKHFGAEKVHLIGYSYTGMLIVMYAMEHPARVQRLVQLGPVPIKFGTEYPKNLTATDEPGDPKEWQELRRLRKENFHETQPKEYCLRENRFLRARLVGDPANAEKISLGPCEHANEWPINLAKHFEFSFGSVQKLELDKEKIAEVEAPVLTVHGRKDRNAPYGAGREWAFTLPNARLLTIPGAAHQAFSEFPDIVLPAVRTFLSGDWPEGVEKVTALEPSA